MEMSFYMRNQLLRDADWAGMAHSLEIRVPYVDVKLFKTLAPILAHWGAADHKKILARSPNIPLSENIINRRKTGFVVPIDQWIESSKNLDEWREISNLARNGCHWSRRWAYTVYKRLTA